MQVFQREVTDDIADRLYAYFRRQRTGRMKVRDARTLIDFVSGPAPAPSGSTTADFAKPRVSGGGAARPTEERIERIVKEYADAAWEESAWDDVFDRLLRQCRKEPDAVRLIRLAFRDRKHETEICERMNISQKTYYNYRKIILNRAAVIATAAGLLDF